VLYSGRRMAKKNPHAVALGKLGGEARGAKLAPDERSDIAQSGGVARAEKLTKAQRKEIAQKAAKARWAKKRV
jgi:hypothetical protein